MYKDVNEVWEKIENAYSDINERIYKKIRIGFNDVVLLCVVIAEIILMYNRMRYGIEYDDESYYIADAVSAAKGNTLFAVTSHGIATGQNLMIIPILKLYAFVRGGSYEGVYLFTRIMYFTFWVIALALVFNILRKYIKLWQNLLFIAMLLPLSCGMGRFQFGYKTNPANLLFLASFLLFDYFENKSERKKWIDTIEMISVGLLCGVSVLANFGYVCSVAVFAIVIVFKSGKFAGIVYYKAIQNGKIFGVYNALSLFIYCGYAY